MTIYRNQTIKGRKIVLDGCTIEHCVLEECQIVYRGGEVRLIAEMHRCSWTFEGAAKNALRVLQMICMMPKDSVSLTALQNGREPDGAP